MSDRPSTATQNPRCPLCAADSVLKEALRHKSGVQHFFKCVSCAVEFPSSPSGRDPAAR